MAVDTAGGGIHGANCGMRIRCSRVTSQASFHRTLIIRRSIVVRIMADAAGKCLSAFEKAFGVLDGADLIRHQQVVWRGIGEPRETDMAPGANRDALFRGQAFWIDNALPRVPVAKRRQMPRSRPMATFAMHATLFSTSQQIRLPVTAKAA